MRRFEAIERQLVWDRLLAIVEDQAQTLMRTAFSPVVREAGDLSAGVFNTKGDMIAQAVTGTPGHVNAMARSVRNFLQEFPISDLNQGDVLLTNDPWLATGHLNDFTVVTPSFLDDRVVAFFASTSHIADVGGRGFGPDANEVYEEGLLVPISKLFDNGNIDETLMRLVRANVRDPVVAEGDLYSLTACNDAGSAKLLEMVREFELENLDSIGEEILNASRQAMEREIGQLPQGIYKYSMSVDGYDDPIHVQCAVTIHKDSIDIDFEGSSPVSRYGINVPLPYAEAYASFGARCLIGNDIPNNEGSLSTIRVSAPVGSILNAEPPCPVSARHALGQMLPDVVIGCLNEVIPDRVPSEGSSCIWNPVLMSDSSASPNFQSPHFVINPIFNGGTGARATRDGLSTTAFPSGVRTTSTEVNEVTSPLVFMRREYRQDSGGAGEFRGGLGQVIEIQHAHGAPFVISKMFDRIGHPARGRNGALDGAPGQVYLKGVGDLSGKGKEIVPAGSTLVMETPGGGGRGIPSERDSRELMKDVDAGLVSAEASVQFYRAKTNRSKSKSLEC
ncbi:MAG: hydantoinase B/oxoprolinase family protein [Gammaproteobacteria bacterium]|nr:hydantoinase B/oxoprolinase family protein [Gammaproteobacteria bacterium]